MSAFSMPLLPFGGGTGDATLRVRRAPHRL
jgi:hypothetical protein